MFIIPKTDYKFDNESKDSDILDKSLSKGFNSLVKALIESTDLSKNEMKALAIFDDDYILKRLINSLKENKKFYKRKRTKELLKGISLMSQNIHSAKFTSLLMKLGGR